jgi:hypothetical protein
VSDRSVKISENFISRLENMADGDTIPVIVLIGRHDSGSGHRRRGENREDVQAVLQDEAQETVRQIDRVLANHGGRRGEIVKLLDAVPVIATAPAVLAIANIPSVRSIIEDQPLRALF